VFGIGDPTHSVTHFNTAKGWLSWSPARTGTPSAARVSSLNVGGGLLILGDPVWPLSQPRVVPADAKTNTSVHGRTDVMLPIGKTCADMVQHQVCGFIFCSHHSVWW
jgi:hypothetical protein